MKAVDTNILVYAHREDSPFHEQALQCVTALAEGRSPWGIPWPCLHEFFAIVAHPKIFDPPTPLAAAIDQIEAWLESPSLVVLSEQSGYWSALKQIVTPARICGAQIHDARIAAMCITHGISELLTADRDFGRFPALKIRNPLITTQQA